MPVEIDMIANERKIFDKYQDYCSSSTVAVRRPGTRMKVDLRVVHRNIDGTAGYNAVCLKLRP